MIVTLGAWFPTTMLTFAKPVWPFASVATSCAV
ncbi:Uncharacterised protein [Mycobacteroides abscessus]|nr:Uncharacterised protein [Mycobacteroides abscessus]